MWERRGGTNISRYILRFFPLVTLNFPQLIGFIAFCMLYNFVLALFKFLFYGPKFFPKAVPKCPL